MYCVCKILTRRKKTDRQANHIIKLRVRPLSEPLNVVLQTQVYEWKKIVVCAQKYQLFTLNSSKGGRAWLQGFYFGACLYDGAANFVREFQDSPLV